MPASDLQNIEIYDNVPGIKTEIDSYLDSADIAKIKFLKACGSDIQDELLQAVIIPNNINVPHLLRMTPGIQPYYIHGDEAIEMIATDTLDRTVENRVVKMLMAQIVIKSPRGHTTIWHCMCELD
jgi:hypothetical protein